VRLPRGWVTVGRVQVIYPRAWLVPRIGRRVNGYAFYRSILPIVRRLASGFSPDIVMGVWAYPDGAAAVRIARDMRCPAVINVIGSDVNALTTDPGLRGIVTDTLVRADHVIALSRPLKD